MRFIEKMLFLLFGLALLFYGVDKIKENMQKKEEPNVYLEERYRVVEFFCKYKRLLPEELLKTYQINKVFPPNSEIFYPAYSADLNTDEKEELIIFTPLYNFSDYYHDRLNIINDYFSVLNKMEHYKKMFKEDMKSKKVITSKRSGKVLENVRLKDYLRIYNIMDFDDSGLITFRDLDKDKKIDMLFLKSMNTMTFKSYS